MTWEAAPTDGSFPDYPDSSGHRVELGGVAEPPAYLGEEIATVKRSVATLRRSPPTSTS